MELNLNQPSPYLSLFTRDSLFCIDLRNLDGGEQIQYPLGWNQIKVLGSCRGFLCISRANDRDVAIWDPFGREHELLPSLDTEIRSGLCRSACVHGFGYDRGNDDYVLLRIVQICEEPIESAVSIYSLRDDTWRQLQGIEMPYSLADQRKRGVFLHHRLHWIMTPEQVPDMAKVLVAFDIPTEHFVEVNQLNFINNRLDMDLTVLGGCLCLILYREQMGVEVWIMRDYRMPEVWYMLFSIPNHSRARGLVQPLAYSPNRHRVLVGMGSETLVWYDLQTNAAAENFHRRGMPNSFEALIMDEPPI